MAIEIDGAAVLRAVIERMELFPDAAADFARTARALVGRQIKAKGTTLSGLQAITEAIGPQALALIIDGLNDTDVKTLAGRFATDRQDVRTSEPKVLRGLLVALASRPAEPVDAPPPAPAHTGSTDIAPPSLRHESVQAKRKKGKKK